MKLPRLFRIVEPPAREMKPRKPRAPKMQAEDLFNVDAVRQFHEVTRPNKIISGFGQRDYHSAKTSRLTAGWNQDNASADTELSTSLRNLRNRSRSLVRDASYAKRAKVLVMNNVVGTGIGMQSQVKTRDGKLNTRINDAVEKQFENWCKAQNCHTGGRLSFSQIERLAMGHVFEAGEIFIRIHPMKMGTSDVPLALEMVEAERVPDEMYIPALTPGIENGNEFRMGVEVDQRFHRPAAYYVRTRHPSDFRYAWRLSGGMEWMERVPATEMFHLAIVDRWPQTRGEPWMHTALRRLNDMEGYSEAEIIRARAQAVTVGAIETPEDPTSWGEKQEDGSYVLEMEPGVIKRLPPGDRFVPGQTSSPNGMMEGFMRGLLRETAAGIGVSYESLSKDYSQSNYSSSRLALLDDRDLWRVCQTWFIDSFRSRLHETWLTRAVMAGAIPELPVELYAGDPLKYGAVRFKPRGWTWIDPSSEIEAFKEAIKAGFTTVTDVVAATAGGMDIEDVIDTREHELEAFDDKGLVFDTSPEYYNAENELAAEQQKIDKQNADKAAKAAEIAAKNPPPPPPGMAPANGEQQPPKQTAEQRTAARDARWTR